APPQFQGVTLEGGGVAPPWVGEGDLNLAHGATSPALNAWDGQDHEGRAATDGQGSEAALDLAARDNLRRSAGGAPAVLGLLVDSENHLAALIVGAGVPVAADAESVIQQAGGHADLLSWSTITDYATPIGISVSVFFYPSARFSRMNHKKALGKAPKGFGLIRHPTRRFNLPVGVISRGAAVPGRTPSPILRSLDSCLRRVPRQAAEEPLIPRLAVPFWRLLADLHQCTDGPFAANFR